MVKEPQGKLALKPISHIEVRRPGGTVPFKTFRIGRYEFEALLGRGGMGEVYRVVIAGAAGFRKPFAVKRMLPRFTTDESTVRMFEDEARLNGILNHANIVQVFEFNRADDTYILVMEYIEGCNLSQLGERLAETGAKLPLSLAAHIIAQVARGLDYAHEKRDPVTQATLGIIHRDITPFNIMISQEGAVKIVDFGIAKAKESASFTIVNMVRGNVSYMSPEQAAGLPLDRRTDIFSACLVLMELVTGQQVFSGDPRNILARAREGRIPSPRELRPDLPEELEKILLKGLAKSRLERFACAGELADALEAYLVRSGIPGGQKALSEFLRGNLADRSLPAPLATEVAPFSDSEKQALLSGANRLEAALSLTQTRMETAPPPLRVAAARRRQTSRKTLSTRALATVSLIILGTVGLTFWLSPEWREPISVSPSLVLPSPSANSAVASVPTLVSPTPERKIPVLSATTPTIVPRAPASAEDAPALSKIRSRWRTLRFFEPRQTIAKATPSAQPTHLATPEKKGAPAELSAQVSDEISDARRYFDRGIEQMKNGSYEEARKSFAHSRGLDETYIPAWLYEIRVSENLQKPEQARQTARLLLRQHPELSDLPPLKRYAEGRDTTSPSGSEKTASPKQGHLKGAYSAPSGPAQED